MTSKPELFDGKSSKPNRHEFERDSGVRDADDLLSLPLEPPCPHRAVPVFKPSRHLRDRVDRGADVSRKLGDGNLTGLE